MVNYPFTPDDGYIADLMAEEEKQIIKDSPTTTMVLLDLLDYMKAQFDLNNDRITKLQNQLDEIQNMQREHEADEDRRFGTLYDVECVVDDIDNRVQEISDGMDNVDYQLSDLRDRVDFMFNKTMEGK